MWINIIGMFSWMPPQLQVLVYGGIAIFLVFALIKFISYVLTVIPFLK